MRVLVTGATGFVGRCLVPALRAHSHEVIRVVRAASQETDVVVPDIRRGLPEDALAAANVVIHLAGIAHRRHGADDDYETLNRDAAILVAQQAAAADVNHFIFFSTSKVYGDSGTEPFHKNSPLNPPDAYSESKAQAEQQISSLQGEMSVSVVRPPMVYGPEAVGNTALLMRAISRGVPIPVPTVPNARSIIYVDELSSAIQTLIARPNEAAGVFQPSDSEPISFEDMAKTLASAMGKRARFVRLPAGVLTVTQLPFRLVGQQPLNPVYRDFELAQDAELRSLGWRHSMSPLEGLRRTAQARA